jgi:hypothetical protein
MIVARQNAVSSPTMKLDLHASVKRFDVPERVLAFAKGRLELITVGGRLIGKGSYAPGWRLSHTAMGHGHAGDAPPEHVGVVLSGRAKMLIGEREIDLTPGDFFHVSSEYDAWVVGYRPCEVLHLSGIEVMVDRLSR